MMMTVDDQNGVAPQKDDEETFGGGVDELLKSYEKTSDPTSKLVEDEFYFGPIEDTITFEYRSGKRRRSAPPFRELVDEYDALWAELGIRRNKLDKVKDATDRIIASRRAYEQVESGTGVPWYVVAAIHNLESTLNFRTHLHNGDPLTAKTVRVPSGRPRQGNPPFTWMESAQDALRYRGIAGISDWNIPRICFVLEGYNGWGYRLYHSHVKSPYLWSFSNQYIKGKYTDDGKWSDEAVSDQIGGMVLLKFMSIIGVISIRPFSEDLAEISSQGLATSLERHLHEEDESGHDHYEIETSDSGDDEEEPSAFDPGQLDPSATEQYDSDDTFIDELPLSEDDTRSFWKSRNPRGATLYRSDGRPVVDPQLLEASAEGARAWEVANPQYRVEIYGPSGGLRAPGGGTRNHTPQPGTGRGAAIDFVMIDRSTGQMLTNHPGARHQHQGKVGQNAPIYQSFFNSVVRAGARQSQGFAEKARFGGYFSSGANAMDTMHIDMRGREVRMGGGDLHRGFTPQQMRAWRIPENYPYRA